MTRIVKKKLNFQERFYTLKFKCSKSSLPFFFSDLGSCSPYSFSFFCPVPDFNYDFEQFFPLDDPDLAFYQDFEKQFGSDNDYLLLAIENPDRTWLDSAFLEKFSRVQTQIGQLKGVDTLISILDIKLPVIGLFGLREIPVLNWETAEQLSSSQEKLTQFEGSFISKDRESFLLLVKNDPGLSKEQGDTLYHQIRQVFQENKLSPKAVAGKIQRQGDFVSLMQNEFKLFLGFSFILMFLALLGIFRSWWGIVIPILVLLFGVLWAFALILYSRKPLDIMSVMQPTIFLIVGLSGLVHYFTHFIQKVEKGD